MPIILASAISLLLLGAVWLVYINRASERIVSSTLPIAAGAIIGIAISVFVFGADPPRKVLFDSTIVIDDLLKWPDKKTALCKGSSIYFSKELLALMSLKNEHLKDADLGKAIHVYNHLLQWEIIARLSLMYNSQWQADFYASPRFRMTQMSPTYQPAMPLTLVSSPHIEEILAGNLFAGLKPPDGLPFNLALPPRSSISISPPGWSDNWSQDDGEIRIEVDRIAVLGPLYTVRIYTRPKLMGQGTYGYQKHIGLSDDQEKRLFTCIFQVRIETETSKWRSGSPALPSYKEWVDQLTEVLRDGFDEQRIFENVRNNGCSNTDLIQAENKKK